MADPADIAIRAHPVDFVVAMIPGAREPGMLTTFGVHAVIVEDGGHTMDAATIAAHQIEGGGGPARRSRARLAAWQALKRWLRQVLNGSRQS